MVRLLIGLLFGSVCCWLLVAYLFLVAISPCSLFVVCSLCAVACSLVFVVVCRSLFVGDCLLLASCVICRSLFVCWSFVVACFLLLGVVCCCLLLIV